MNANLNRVLKLSTALLLQVSFFVAGTSPMAASTGEKKPSKNKDIIAMLPDQAAMTDGADFIKRMQSAADSYQSYYFEYKMTALKKGKVVEEGKFWFKKPRLIRLEETGSYKHGCIAVLTSDGKVKGRGGGAFSMFTMDLSPDSNMLRSANGYPMVKSDLASLAAALKQFLAEGKSAKVTTEPIQIDSQSEKVFVLDVYQEPSHQIYKRVAVDIKSTLPLEWWDFESGKLVSHSIWKTFKGNIAIADNLFEDTSHQ